MATATEADVGETFMSLTAPDEAGEVTAGSFYAEEAISLPFLVTVDFLSDKRNIDPPDILHKAVCLTLRTRGGPVRHLHGLVRRIAATGEQLRDIFTYNIEVVP